MIAKDDDFPTAGVWEKLAAPLDANDISWRIDSKPKARDGKYFARFVCYVEAGTVRERLDSVVPGEWDLTLELLPSVVTHEGSETAMALKGRLQVLGVIREDVGQGPDYKQAATDAFKRAAVRFGIGHELYAMEQNWVEVDGEGKFAKPVEDPQAAYDRRYGSSKQNPNPTVRSTPRSTSTSAAPSAAPTTGRQTADDSATTDEPSCPKCGGSQMYDNRAENAQRIARGEKARPDFKCKNANCGGLIWPPKDRKNTGMDAEQFTPYPEPQDSDDELPF